MDPLFYRTLFFEIFASAPPPAEGETHKTDRTQKVEICKKKMWIVYVHIIVFHDNWLSNQLRTIICETIGHKGGSNLFASQSQHLKTLHVGHIRCILFKMISSKLVEQN